MVTYYRGPSALITHRAFEVWYPHPRRFPIEELYDVHVVRSGAAALAVGSTRFAGASAVVAAACSPFLHTTTSWVVVLGFVVVPGVFSGACWCLSRPEYELCATYRGRPVQLYRSRDPRTFGQVKRALVRALEAYDHA
jgi:Family of unknown function (DUF6232)